MNIVTAITQRACKRAFLPTVPGREVITKILEAARWAPSGVNSQPWHVAVVSGETKQQLSQAIIAARHAGIPENPDYDYYPKEWHEPYKSRRKACGLALYQALNIAYEDKKRREEVWENNYRFFDAPIGLIFYLEKHLSAGAWVDMGMFIQNVMLAALEFNLATCPQASLAEYPDIVRQHLAISHDFHIVCGMALGYPDPQAAINQYRTAREPIENFVKWVE